MLHVAACVMHCQLPGSDASCGVAYSPSQEARGEGEQAASCDALVHGSWQCITHAEVVYIL